MRGPEQVQALDAAAAQPGGEPAPAPVLSWPAFRALCAAPPLQAPGAPLLPATFAPLGRDEPPGPGTLLGLDAEFVAHSPPDTALRGRAPGRVW